MVALAVSCAEPDPVAKDCTVKILWLDGKTSEIVIKEGSYILPSAKGTTAEYEEKDYVWTVSGKDFESGEAIDVSNDISISQKCTVSEKWDGELLGEEDVKAKLVSDGKKDITFMTIDSDGSEKETKYNKDCYHVDVSSALDFASVIQNLNEFGNACYVINLKNSIDLAKKTWTPIILDGYGSLNGCEIIVNGNGYSIYNMSIEEAVKDKNGKEINSVGLFSGAWSTVKLEINDLTIDGAIVKCESNESFFVCAAGFVGSVDSSHSVKLKNCILKDSKIESSNYVGGMMGWNSGYDALNNGAVKTHVDFISCKVIGSKLSAKGSVGGIIGHAGASAYTYNNVESCTVEKTSIASTGDSDKKAGAIVGTVNVGEMKIEKSSYNNDMTVVSHETAINERCYGRFVPNSTGKLIIDGVEVTN